MLERLFVGNHCENPPSECERIQQANRTIKCSHSSLCIANDTEKLKQINQVPIDACQSEREMILEKYFTCLMNQSADDCRCPSSNFFS